ncbi:MAG: endolytic transglycosylase MltG [Deltaproteobacteria bacterium]|nr:endolytic transglycosylase MltG [Deltaproteobacteria bacterium]
MLKHRKNISGAAALYNDFIWGANSGLRRLQLAILTILFVLICVATSLYLDLLIYGKEPAGTEPGEQVVTITPGQRFKAFAVMLHEAGIIAHPIKFELFARIKGLDKQIKAGEYILSSAMSPEKILDIMVGGKVRLYRLTIPEGYNLRQVSRTVAESGFGTETDFFKTAVDPTLAGKQGIDADTFEGYLFPDTYYFPKDATPETIISTMTRRFRAVFRPEWEDQARAIGFSIHQVVTLASIIEKETGTPSERPIISSVFHNRLKRKMRLASDPTVIYGIKDFDGNITRKHLKTPTPYNTYTIKGLPPGPIANTGEASLKAALYPDDTRFLYFVSKKDRTHQFSTNIKDHNRAVRKYQLNR